MTGSTAVSSAGVASVVADFRRVYCEVIFFAARHELSALFQKIYKLRCGHATRRAGVEAFVLTEPFDNGVYELSFCSVTVSLHHMEYFVSVYHILFVFPAKILEFMECLVRLVFSNGSYWRI